MQEPGKKWHSWVSNFFYGVNWPAAHLMQPYTGEGVNMDMLDTLELSQCLTGTHFPDGHSAIGAYEMQMRERALEVAKQIMKSTHTLHIIHHVHAGHV